MKFMQRLEYFLMPKEVVSRSNLPAARERSTAAGGFKMSCQRCVQLIPLSIL
jgi:hypothetical protein